MEHVDEAKLLEFAAGALSDSEKSEVEAHLDDCAECRELAVHLVKAKDLIFEGADHLVPTDKVTSERVAVAMDATRPKPKSDPSVARTEQVDEDFVARAMAAGPKSHRLPKGTAIGRYVTIERIGSGGMGIIYSAYDPQLDRKVALKLLRPDRTTSSTDDPTARLLREAQAMARLSHPNVIGVHDVGIWRGQVFVAMKFVEGVTLKEWLAQKPRTHAEILQMYLQAGAGLAAAHKAGVVHRDFKPDNVLVGTDGIARVMDFGLARVEGPISLPGLEAEGVVLPAGEITRTGAFMGTPAYMAPEQFHGEVVDARADQFSFAVAVYEALYQERPFAAQTLTSLGREIKAGQIRTAPVETKVSARMRKALLRALSPLPEKRFASMEALLAALSPRRRDGRPRALVALGAIALVATAAAVRFYVVGQTHCDEAARPVDAAWNDARRAQVRAAFTSTQVPWANDAYAEVTRRLDEWTSAWAAQRIDACEARARREQTPEVFELRNRCLDRALADFDALATMYMGADARVLPGASAATSALRPLDRCADVALLRALPSRAPTGQDLLARARALYFDGRYADAQASAEGARDAARHLKDPLGEAEATWLDGASLLARGDAKSAEPLLHDASVKAAEAHDEPLQTRALATLMRALAAERHFKEAHFYGKYAASIAERIGANAAQRADLDRAEAEAYLAEGAADAARAHAAAAVELTQPGGPSAPLFDSLLLLAEAQSRLQLGDEAVATYRRALTTGEAAYGASHPALTRAVVPLTRALLSRGEISEAMAQLTRAQLNSSRADSATQALVADTLGRVLAQAGKSDDAFQAFRGAAQLAGERCGAPCIDLGRAVETSNPALAEESYERARRFAESSGDEALAGEAYVGEGRLRAAKRLPAAVDLLERGASLLEQSGAESGRVAAAHFALARALWRDASQRERAKGLLTRAKQELSGTGAEAAPLRAEVDAFIDSHR